MTDTDLVTNDSESSREDDIKYLNSDIVHGSPFSGSLYMTGVPITVKITASNETDDLIQEASKKGKMKHPILGRWHMSDKSWYELTMTHGEYEWKLRKTIADISSLHHSLLNRMRVRAMLLFGKDKPVQLGHFPSKVEIFMGSMMGEPKKMIENYLQSILHSEVARDADCVVKFFEISPLSFDKRLGISKWKEDLVNKLPSHTLLPICCLTTLFKQPRWLVLKDTYLIYMTRKVNRMSSEDSNMNVFEMDPKNGTLSFPGQTRRNWRLCKVLLMDRMFAFKPKIQKSTRINLLKLYNTHGRLVTICPSSAKLIEWSEALAAVLHTKAARDYVATNRFGSFAPPRPGTHITVFIDGAYYMEAVARAIAQAQREIFITDWCMNPEIFLRRPIHQNTWRLDKLLQAKAQQGVRICVILYAGIEKVVSFNSARTAWHLHNLHPNIHVYLSPLIKWFWSHHEKMVAIDQSIAFMGGIDLCFGRWDTVDHKLEDVYKSAPNTQRMALPPPETPTVILTTPIKSRKSSAVHEFQIEEVSRNRESASATRDRKISQPGRPQVDRRLSSWLLPKQLRRNRPVLHDRRVREAAKPDVRNRRFPAMFLRAGMALKGVFNRRPSTAQMYSSKHEPMPTEDNLLFLESQWGGDQRAEVAGFDNLAFEDDEGAQVDPSFLDELENLCEIGQRCTWVGQDYVNWVVCETDGKAHAAKDLVDRQSVPRMPWHDVACVVSGQVAVDLSRHFIQRWNSIRNSRIRLATKGTSAREDRRRKPLLIPTPPCAPWTETHLSTVLRDPRQAALCQVQALRSVSNWSLCVPAGNSKRGFREEFQRWLHGDEDPPNSSNEEIGLETSILSAYVNTILDAEKFILIENQFFISYIMSSDFDAQMNAESAASQTNRKPNVSTTCDPHARLPSTSQNMQVKNRIVDAIFLRIVRAHREGKPFRVFIIMPLIPGFVGEFGNPTSRSQHMIWHYTRLSLFKGEQALFPRLARMVPDPNDYVSVCGLRTYGEWPNGNLKTELVYVHSKVMLVDDRRMILGSANLNDRSTRGKRDSELAVLIENNPRYAQDICPFVRRFRRSLMAEHLGVLPTLERANRDNEWPDELLNDPVCDEFFHGVWKATAEKNADIFEKVFNVIPSNKLKTFNDCKEYRQKVPLSVADPPQAREMLQSVRGYLVTLPDQFLADEDLTPPPGTLENLAPASIWL